MLLDPLIVFPLVGTEASAAILIAVFGISKLAAAFITQGGPSCFAMQVIKE